MKTALFDYELPKELIAQKPVEPRDASRLMVVDRRTGEIAHRHFREIGEYLRTGDLLVFNETRVIPARLLGHKVPTGGRVELLLLKRRDERTWEALVGGKRVRPGTRLRFADGGDLTLDAEVVEETGESGRVVRFERPVEPLLDRLGLIPLPPYVHEPLEDPERYQTVYARVTGSVAAPTAGLHFTPDLLLRLREMGVQFAFLTLDIGLDTFRPVTEEEVEDHPMHTEFCRLPPETAQAVNQAHLEGRRVIAVGTTAVRVLESAAQACSEEDACPFARVTAFEGPTDLFIYPGYRFRVVDALITNFHLPRSTLLMLVSAFAGRDLILRAYRQAVEMRYRFFSFGDAMLIL
ncbi:MAG: tRNA preQ1(34) S-adenosylmethionine ribosyltransferase-isomerase QueA [Anaerolineae bacterium]